MKNQLEVFSDTTALLNGKDILYFLYCSTGCISYVVPEEKEGGTKWVDKINLCIKIDNILSTKKNIRPHKSCQMCQVPIVSNEKKQKFHNASCRQNYARLSRRVKEMKFEDGFWTIGYYRIAIKKNALVVWDREIRCEISLVKVSNKKQLYKELYDEEGARLIVCDGSGGKDAYLMKPKNECHPRFLSFAKVFIEQHNFKEGEIMP